MRSNALFSLPVLTGVWLVGCSCNNNNNITPQEPDEVFNDIGSWLGLDALADGSLCLLEGEAWRLEGDEWRDRMRSEGRDRDFLPDNFLALSTAAFGHKA